MSIFDRAIKNIEKTSLPSFEEKLNEVATMSVAENEQLSRNFWESGSKDTLRELLEPIKVGADVTVSMIDCLSRLATDLVMLQARNSVQHHYFLREIRRLEGK